MNHDKQSDGHGRHRLIRRDSSQIGRFIMEAIHIVVFVISTIFTDQPFMD